MAPLSRVTLDAGEPHVRLRLLDGRFSPIELPADLGCATVDLAPGVYVAEFETSASRVQKEFLVLPARLALRQGQREQVIRPESESAALIDAAAPLDGTNAFVSWDAEVIEAASREPHRIAGESDHGSLLVVIRRRPLAGDRRSCVEAPFELSPWQRGVRLYTHDGREIEIANAARTESGRGLACAHLALPAGMYELRLDAGGQQLSQYLCVARGIQTQAFLTDRSQPGRPAPLGAARFSVHLIGLSDRFDPSAAGARVAEELLNLAGSNLRPRATPEVRDELLRLPSLMSHLAFWLSQIDLHGSQPVLDVERVRELYRRLPNLPDAEVLMSTAEGGVAAGSLDRAVHDVVVPPMLARAWDLALMGENHGVMAVAPGSLAARLGPSIVGGAPWLRFRSHAGRDSAPRPDDPSEGFVGLAGMTFDEALSELRRRVTGDDISARVQYNSTHLSVSERRLMTLLCPGIDTTVRRIFEQTGDSVDAIAPPSEGSMVLALRMPRASLSLVADTALGKLTASTILPTDEQLSEFVDAEAGADSIVRQPLELLRSTSSEVLHLIEDRPLTLLTLVYLQYRGAPARPAQMDDDEIADHLSGLGFVHQSTQTPLRAAHISSAVSAAARLLDEFYDRMPPPEDRCVWDEIEIRLTSIGRYRPGNLCTVRRAPHLTHVSNPGARFWTDDPRSYSLCLGGPSRVARPQSVGRTPASSETRSARDRYFRAEVRKTLAERAALPELT
jgi:hypothetical protein